MATDTVFIEEYLHFKQIAQNLDLDLDLIREFFQAFVNHSMITLHVDNLSGINAHHQCESIFKAFGLAFANAVKIDSSKKITSTKGLI